MRRFAARLAALATALACVVATLTLATSPAGAAPQYPVPYDFLPSAVVAGVNFTADPPGANDWNCRPGAAHPRPVVLVHGLTGDKTTNWQTYAPLLANNGYCVYALTYGRSPLLPAPYDEAFGGLVPMQQSARQLHAFVAKVLAATGASQVDIVGHSEGTVMPDYYAKFLGGARYIHAYVSLAPLWHGTSPLGLATLAALGTPFGVTPATFTLLAPVCGSCAQFLSGSPFMTAVRSGGTPAVPGIAYTNIVTRYDELVQPYTSGIQAGMTNEVVQDHCPLDLSEHFEIAADPVAAALVLNALDPAHPRPVPCRPVLPFVGT
ncbi:MAG: lipase [Jatrophihabitans sp.]|nr:MAG: lipase [Jatrophihabitans sp.]